MTCSYFERISKNTEDSFDFDQSIIAYSSESGCCKERWSRENAQVLMQEKNIEHYTDHSKNGFNAMRSMREG